MRVDARRGGYIQTFAMFLPRGKSEASYACVVFCASRPAGECVVSRQTVDRHMP